MISDNQQEESVSNPHDAAFKSAFQKKELAQAFFRHYLPVEIVKHVNLENLEIVNKSYVDEKLKEKHSDIIYRTLIKDRTGFLYILFEHQSSPDYWMVFRLLSYMINIWKGYIDQSPKEKYLPVIIPMVLYHGEASWNSFLCFIQLIEGHEDFAEFIPDFSYQLYDLGVYQDEMLIFGDYMALSVVLYLFKHIFDKDFGEIFGYAINLLTRIKDEKIFLEFLEWILRYAYHARNENEEEFKKIVDEETERLCDERVRRSAMTLAERIEQRGRFKGLEEGKAIILFKQLKKRFGNIPPLLEQKLKQADVNILDRFGESVFDFKDIADAEKWWEMQN